LTCVLNAFLYSLTNEWKSDNFIAILSDMETKQLFSNRVADYLKYRPAYPTEIIDLLSSEYGLSKKKLVADIGSGTGLLSRLFLTTGNSVWCVEPNAEMRRAAELELMQNKGFYSVDGSAETTTLAPDYYDYVVAGQAFHWFDMQKAQQEFCRIIKPSGRVVFIWNSRRTDTPFLTEYEKLLQQYAATYAISRHRNITTETISEFTRSPVKLHIFPNRQTFDLTSLKGRMLSSSYVPKAGQPGYEKMIIELVRLFNKFEEDQRISFLYETRMYVSEMRCH